MSEPPARPPHNAAALPSCLIRTGCVLCAIRTGKSAIIIPQQNVTVVVLRGHHVLECVPIVRRTNLLFAEEPRLVHLHTV